MLGGGCLGKDKEFTGIFYFSRDVVGLRRERGGRGVGMGVGMGVGVAGPPEKQGPGTEAPGKRGRSRRFKETGSKTPCKKSWNLIGLFRS